MTAQLTDDQRHRIDWDKNQGLLPAIIQHADDGRVLMMGYMNREALAATEAKGLVHFYSRTRQRLWQKGESSGNVLRVAGVELDCDGDTLLLQAYPAGPTCHLGSRSCFDAQETSGLPLTFLAYLERVIRQRKNQAPENSYTSRLLTAGAARIAQKVGEEGVEVALAAVQGLKQQTVEESADLLYHLLVLLAQQELTLGQVVSCLQQRHSPAGQDGNDGE